jgi:hypothetical protein
VLVDNEDYDRVVASGPWHLLKSRATFYALRKSRDTSGAKQIALLHRLILADLLTPDLQVDHLSGDGLDCRRVNMRVVTTAENSQNCRRRVWLGRPKSSQYRGVSWNKLTKRWHASVTVSQKMTNLGEFRSEEEAARVAADARARLMPWSNESRHPAPSPGA